MDLLKKLKRPRRRTGKSPPVQVRAEWEALEPLYALKRQLVEARLSENLSQKELAERCGLKQSTLARLESGKSSPSFKSLQRIAKGLGKKLTVTFQ